jgi:hypothetical protein
MRKPKSLKDYMIQGLLRSVMFTIGLVSTAFILSVMSSTENVAEERPDAAGSPSWLMEKHNCWSGAAPEGVEIPGHVVIRYEGEVAAQYRGSKAVGVALDHIFTEPNPDVAEVYGFCR